jgi:hypothetical protein
LIHDLIDHDSQSSGDSVADTFLGLRRGVRCRHDLIVQCLIPGMKTDQQTTDTRIPQRHTRGGGQKSSIGVERALNSVSSKPHRQIVNDTGPDDKRFAAGDSDIKHMR